MRTLVLAAGMAIAMTGSAFAMGGCSWGSKVDVVAEAPKAAPEATRSADIVVAEVPPVEVKLAPVQTASLYDAKIRQ